MYEYVVSKLALEIAMKSPVRQLVRLKMRLISLHVRASIAVAGRPRQRRFSLNGDSSSSSSLHSSLSIVRGSSCVGDCGDERYEYRYVPPVHSSTERALIV
jgi:hypothetical protein